MIRPGATLGLLGGGQLGRMFTVAARTLGYRVSVLDPDPHAPAAEFATAHLTAAYDDPAALDELARTCAAVTTEFENAPAGALDALAARIVVRPAGASVAIAQDRRREKAFFAANRFAIGRWARIDSPADFDAALAAVPLPALLKTARLGYDGKGQARIASRDELAATFASWKGAPCVLEELLVLEREVSVVLARSDDGAVAVFPVAENRHAHGILDVTIAPARIGTALADEATAIAVRLAASLEYVGVLAVEMFVVGGKLLLNEIAPRPHNSGHYTIDACRTSQFEQQARVLCGLPLGDPSQHTPAVMVNLLGDIWARGEPDWDAVLSHPGAHLHLYGKREARPGRKMGHVTVCEASPERTLAAALAIRASLGIGAPGESVEAPGRIQAGISLRGEPMKSPVAIASLLAAALVTFNLAAHAADKRETRPVTDFTAIGVAAPVNVHITQGDAPTLAIEGPEEALAQIETVVENGSLRIKLDRHSTNWRSKVNVYVTARRIEALSISGSGDISAPALTGDALKLSISGSGDMRIGGKVEGLTASIAGSGDIRAGDLDAQRVNVSIAGSGDATVRARQALSVSVAGSGDVRYYGDPTVAKSIHGSGSVRRLGGAAS